MLATRAETICRFGVVRLGWAWALSRLLGGPDDQLWLWMPIAMTPGALAALCIQARQIERANLPMLGRASAQ